MALALPDQAQSIVFENTTACDFYVKVMYGDISACNYCHPVTWYYCTVTNQYEWDCCICGTQNHCDCQTSGTFSCGQPSWNVMYYVAANTTVSFSPAGSVCRFYIMDGVPSNVLHECSCNQQECGCHTILYGYCGGIADVTIDVTPGWSIKWY